MKMPKFHCTFVLLLQAMTKKAVFLFYFVCHMFTGHIKAIICELPFSMLLFLLCTEFLLLLSILRKLASILLC